MASKTNSLLDFKETSRIIDERIRDHTKLLMSTKHLIWRSFLSGVFTGLGGVVGATVGVAILTAILLRFGGLPVIGQYFQQAGQKVEQGVKK